MNTYKPGQKVWVRAVYWHRGRIAADLGHETYIVSWGGGSMRTTETPANLAPRKGWRR